MVDSEGNPLVPDKSSKEMHNKELDRIVTHVWKVANGE